MEISKIWGLDYKWQLSFYFKNTLMIVDVKQCHCLIVHKLKKSDILHRAAKQRKLKFICLLISLPPDH